MTLREIKAVLAQRPIALTKSLGQNFLHDQNQLQRIVEAAELSATDQVLEVGPGLGALTERLIERAGRVLAIEKDQRLAEILRQRFGATTHLTLVVADALDLLRAESRDWSDWKLVANLPYSVASPLLVELALSPSPPQRMVVTLQWEVAQRLMANAADDDYGVLTLLVQLAFAPRDTFKIGPACFFPEPDVDSACVTLMRRAAPLLPVDAAKTFVRIVKRSFSQRRKMMFKLLKAEWPVPALTAAFARVGLDERTRAEAVSLTQFVELTQALQHP